MTNKIAILGDTHFGVRNDLTVFHSHFEKFYTSMLDTLEEQGVTTLIQVGDLFDRRKYINFYTLSESRRYFFDQLQARGIKMITLVGNHDIYWRESLSVNSADMLLRDYDNIEVVSQPQTLPLGTTTIDIIPWIAADNQHEIAQFIRDSKSDLCFGHFEIAGFAMYRGMEAHDGLSMDMFEKYEHVFSGHYHTRSQKGNITYVGTPYEMTWQDYNDPKGFHIFNINTRQLEFFPNGNTIFARVDYDDTCDVVDLDAFSLRGCFVKLVVTNKTDLYKFDQFVNKLYTKGCYEIKIVEDLSEFNEGAIDEEIDLEDTMDVLSNYIDSIETDADKERIKSFMKSLYIEAVNIEVV